MKNYFIDGLKALTKKQRRKENKSKMIWEDLMSKIRNALIIIMLAIIVFAISACERKGALYQNQPPQIQITSYEGVDSLNTAQVANSTIFQQKIYWEAHDSDGVVKNYAFRILKEDGTPYLNEFGDPIGVPGYAVVDEDGWVYHYQPGADESIPLEATTQKTIWTDQVYAVINFPANVDGDSAQVVSLFEVKCIDDRGDENVQPAIRYFKSHSYKPGLNVGSNRGDINGKVVGTGMVLSFTIMDDDPFVDTEADFFLFKLEKRTLNGLVISEADGGYTADQWWSTKYETNKYQYLITLDDFDGTRAALKTNNFLGGAPVDSTYIVAKVIDIAGIVSEEKVIGFAVKEGFYPNTIIYNGQTQNGAASGNNIFLLGQNHFVTYIDGALGQLIPSIMTTEGTHYSTPFFISKDGEYSAVHSNDLRIYMHWGYAKEYDGNSPGNKSVGTVNDEITGQNYFSEIKYYDIRLDGEPYYYAPLPASQYNVIDEDTGKEWLRVPVSQSIAQKTVLTGLAPGVHKIEVRAVDLQDVADKTPSTFIFRLFEMIPASQKEGVLVIDDSPNNSSAPDDLLDGYYSKEGFFAGYDGIVDVLDRSELESTVWINLHWSKDVLCPSDLQHYKTVVYYADSPNEGNNFWKEYDVLNLYLRNGGNMIVSGGKNLSTNVQTNLVNQSFPILQTYFGIPMQKTAIAVVESNGEQASFLNLQYFLGANADPASGFNQQIDLQLPSFYNLVNMHNALGPVAYFKESSLLTGTDVIYRFICREPEDEPNRPSQAEFDFYTGQPVGLRRITANSKCYIFGFPLSYMVVDQVNALMIDILNEIDGE
jgi:predicted small lipoprotein YifL